MNKQHVLLSFHTGVETNTPMENHWRKLRLRGVCMSSMLDHHTPHLWDPDQYLGAEVLAGCVQKGGRGKESVQHAELWGAEVLLECVQYV